MGWVMLAAFMAGWTFRASIAAQASGSHVGAALFAGLCIANCAIAIVAARHARGTR